MDLESRNHSKFKDEGRGLEMRIRFFIRQKQGASLSAAGATEEEQEVAATPSRQ